MKLLIVLAACVAVAVAQTGRAEEVAACVGLGHPGYNIVLKRELNNPQESTCRVICQNVRDYVPGGLGGQGTLTEGTCIAEMKSYPGNDGSPLLFLYPYGEEDSCTSDFSNRCCCHFTNHA